MSKNLKLILSIIGAVLAVALITGGIVAIASAVKKNQQSKCKHEYGELELVSEATCDTDGMQIQVCALCDYENVVKIPAFGHTEESISVKAPTCTETGLTDGVICATCEEVIVAQSVVPALGHNVVVDTAIAPGCTTSGITAGSHCSRCEMVLESQKTLPAIGHTIVEIEGYAPTCSENGKTNGSKCSNCGVVYGGQETILATGHIDGNNDMICDSCGIQDTNLLLDKFANPENYTEVDAKVGDSVVGKVIRFYREETGVSQLSITIDNNAITIGSMSKEIIGSEYDTIYWYSSTPFSMDAFTFAQYDEYVDVYITVGSYTGIVYAGTDSERTVTLVITEDSVITKLYDEGMVKFLELNS